MASDQLKSKLLEQVRHEWESEYYYYAMMAWLTNNDYTGFAKWFQKQAEEEHVHGMKILDYLAQINAEVKLPPSLTIPAADFKDIHDIFERSLKHEQKVTALINDLVDLAIKENDHKTNHFLQWYVGEQHEEESLFSSLVDKINLVAYDGRGLYLIDRELGKMAAMTTAAPAK